MFAIRIANRLLSLFNKLCDRVTGQEGDRLERNKNAKSASVYSFQGVRLNKPNTLKRYLIQWCAKVSQKPPKLCTEAL